jgi:CheY-like chemotaxis protein/anti-sigma regulatory factor (Ser/Thr protein kinase)
VIERQTRHMARLIGDLLDIGRVSAGKVGLERERLDLGEVVGNVIRTWLASGRFERHRVSHELAPVWVDADRTRLEQIVANLLDNSLKFTPTGKAIRLSVRAEGDAAVLCVEDEGAGIPPADSQRVFDVFVQGSHGQGGMGIGLALVKRLAELHGGSVRVASEGADRGAAFTVRLPAMSAPPTQPSSAPLRRPGALSVLLVEDNDDAREMLKATLASNGHEVRVARDGASGLALAAASPPDVALIDVGLPDMDGYEVARRLRAARGGRRLGLVAITGFGRPEDQQRAFDAGFDAHLTKPVTPDRLKQALAGLR